jgi:hypothetical protein
MAIEGNLKLASTWTGANLSDANVIGLFNPIKPN